MKRILFIGAACFGGLILLLALLVGLFIYFRPEQAPLLPTAPEHGTAFILKWEASQQGGADTNVVTQLRELMRKRFASVGVRIYWEPVSSNSVRVMAPFTGEKQAESAKKLMSRGGRLEFRLVHPESEKFLKEDFTEPGYEKLATAAVGSRYGETFLVEKKTVLAGNYITSAYVDRDPQGYPEIQFVLNSQGKKIFSDVTTANVGQRLAIVLDGQLINAPIIHMPITGGQAVITCGFSMDEAHELANSLELPLPFPITVTVEKSY
jgi:SecD/SecF fusion protein